MKHGAAPPVTIARVETESYWRKQSSSSSRVAAVAISTIANAEFNAESIIPATTKYAIITVQQLRLSYTQRRSNMTKKRDKFILKGKHTFGREPRVFGRAVRVER